MVIRLTKVRLAAAALAAAATWFAGGAALAQTAKALPPAVQALIAPAKAEPGLTVYGISANPDEERIFAKAVSDFYGFDFKLKMVSGLHPQKISELVISTKQGVPSGLDVFWTAATGAEDLDNAGAIERLDWKKEFGVDDKLLWGKHGLRAQDGTLIIVIYNKNLIPDAQAPKKYEDLLNPAYKGRIAIPRAPGIFSFLAYHLGEQKTVALVKDLMDKQQARVLATFPDVRTRVISGEFAIGIGMDAFQEKRKGAPVDTAPIDPVIVTPWASHVMKDAKSPNMARLWSYWLTTPEGQTSMDRGRGISRYDADGTELWKLAQGKKVVVVDAEFSIKESNRYNAIFGPIMGLVR